MNRVNPYSCITYKTAEFPVNTEMHVDTKNQIARRHVILKDSSCQVDEKAEEVPLKQTDKGVNLVISQPYGANGVEPLTKLPINNIYYSMYDPRQVRPKKTRKRSKVVKQAKEKEPDRKGVDLNLEEDERPEKSFYANLMKKRPLVNELVKSVEGSNKSKKGSIKADITYPYRPVEEVNRPIEKPVIKEQEKLKPELAKPPVDTKRLELNEEKAKDHQTKEAESKQPNGNLLKQQDSKLSEQNIFNSKPTSSLFDKKPTEEKTTGLFLGTTKPSDNIKTGLFTAKPEEPQTKEKEEKTTTQPLFTNQQPSLLFKNAPEQTEDKSKAEAKPQTQPLFNMENKTPEEGKPSGLLFAQTKPADNNKTEPPKPLFGDHSSNLFSNADKQAKDNIDKPSITAPVTQPTEVKAPETSLFNQSNENKPAQSLFTGTGFTVNTNLGTGLFGSKLAEIPNKSTNIVNEPTKQTKDLQPIAEEKNTAFEEEKEDKQVAQENQPQDAKPSSPLLNLSANQNDKSLFTSNAANLPPNENPLAQNKQSMFGSTTNQPGNMFKQSENIPNTPPSQQNAKQTSSPFNLGGNVNGPFPSPTGNNPNPFLSAPTFKADPKSPNPFIGSQKSSAMNKSSGSQKNDILSQRINDIGTQGLNAGQQAPAIGFGQTNSGLFGNQQGSLFGSSNNQQNQNSLFANNQNPGGGLFQGQGTLFKNNNSQG